MNAPAERRQQARVAELEIPFAAHEQITTEYSYKYTVAGFGSLARCAGLEVSHAWRDPENAFAVLCLDRPSTPPPPPPSLQTLS